MINFLKKNSTIYDAFLKFTEISKKSIVVSDESKKLYGVISDGDIRRAILRNKNLSRTINGIYNTKPQYLIEDSFTYEQCKNLFLKKEIEIIPIVNKNNQVIKVISWSEFFSKKKKIKKKKLNLEVVIMAGGQGTRLKPYTNVLPKPLMPIGNQTAIETIIDSFLNYNCNNFFIMVHYKAEIIKAFFKELKPKYKVNFFKEKKQLGTIGGLKLLKNKFNKKAKDILVSNCDVIHDFNYSDFYNHHKSNNFDITLVVSTKNYKIPYGVCEINNDGSLKRVHEKPEQKFLINTGLYLIKKKVINLISNSVSLNINELFEMVKKKNYKIGVYPINDFNWKDIGQLKEYFETLNIQEK